MARLMLTCVLLTVGLVAFGIAADLDGRWIGEMQGPEGSMEMVFTFKVDGDTLTGSVQNPNNVWTLFMSIYPSFQQPRMKRCIGW